MKTKLLLAAAAAAAAAASAVGFAAVWPRVNGLECSVVQTTKSESGWVPANDGARLMTIELLPDGKAKLYEAGSSAIVPMTATDIAYVVGKDETIDLSGNRKSYSSAIHIDRITGQYRSGDTGPGWSTDTKGYCRPIHVATNM
jgi:hypothetical protein